ncbi:MAG: hypothetical protein V3T72_13615 [Thermoanaerobaculia bacterium]
MTSPGATRFERVLDRLKYDGRPWPAREEPPELRPVAGDGGDDELGRVVAAALGGTSLPPVRQVLAGRVWWSLGGWPSATERDTGAEQAQFRKTCEDLARRGAECGLTSWGEAVHSRRLGEAFAAFLVDFQIRRTVMGTGDDCPPRWGLPACQAAVAFFNIVALAGAHERCRVDVSSLEEPVRHWLRSAAATPTVAAGDVLLFHRFGQALARFIEGLQARRDAADAAAEKELEQLQEATRGDHWLFGWLFTWPWPFEWLPWLLLGASVRSRARQAALAGRRHLELMQRLDAVLERLHNPRGTGLVDGWLALDPLNARTPDGGSRPPAAGNRTRLSLVSLADFRDNHGLAYWLIRELARSSALHADSPANWSPWVLEVLQHLSQSGVGEDGRAWVARRFLMRFYQFWGNSCPPVDEVREMMASVTKPRPQFRSFAEPWKQLERALRRPDGDSTPPAEAGERARAEYHQMLDSGEVETLQQLFRPMSA